MIGTDKLLYKCKLLNDLSGGSFLKKLFDVQLLVTSWLEKIRDETVNQDQMLIDLFVKRVDVFDDPDSKERKAVIRLSVCGQSESSETVSFGSPLKIIVRESGLFYYPAKMETEIMSDSPVGKIGLFICVFQ